MTNWAHEENKKVSLDESDIVSKLVPPRRSLIAAIGGALVASLTGIRSFAAQRGGDADPAPSQGGDAQPPADRDPSDRRPVPRGFLSNPPRFRDGEISAKVGLPVEVPTRAGCADGQVTVDRVEVLTGSLPPGLSFRQSDLAIVGVPTRAGTWYLRVQWVNVVCAGKSHGNHWQDLMIKTEGSSAPLQIP